MAQEDHFVLHQHLPEMRQLLDIDNILIYFLAVNCLPENDIRLIEDAQKINADKAALVLARLIKQRGSLDKFFEALKRSAHEDDHPGHKELLSILQKTVQGEKETQEDHPFELPVAVVPQPQKTVWAISHEGSIDTRGHVPQSSSAEDERKANQSNGDAASNGIPYKTVCYGNGATILLAFLLVGGSIAAITIGGLGFGGQLKCSNILNIYNLLFGLWGIATFVLLVGIGVYGGWIKYKKKDHYCTCQSCKEYAFVSVLIALATCFILYSIGMIIFSSAVVYGSYESYVNPTINQTSQCSTPIYYFSFVSVTLAYISVFVLAVVGIVVASVCIYTRLSS